MTQEQLEQLRKYVLDTQLLFNKNEFENTNEIFDYFYENILKTKINIFLILNELKNINKFLEQKQNEINILFIRMYNEILDILYDIDENQSNISLESNIRLILERWLIFKNLTDCSEDEQKFKFNIYKISGFMNRDINKCKNITDNIKEESYKQNQLIDESYVNIKSTNTYKNLTNKNIIDDKKINKNNFKPTLNNNICNYSTGWNDLLDKFSLSNDKNDLYSFLSYKVHPSYLNYYQYNHNNKEINFYMILTLISNFIYDFNNYFKIEFNFKYHKELFLYKGL